MSARNGGRDIDPYLEAASSSGSGEDWNPSARTLRGCLEGGMEVETHDGTKLVASRMIPALDESAAGNENEDDYSVPWESMREESRQDIDRRTNERIIAIAVKGRLRKTRS